MRRNMLGMVQPGVWVCFFAYMHLYSLQGRHSYWVSIFILDSAPAVNASGQNHDFNGQQLLI
jgi:hypothetical protein